MDQILTPLKPFFFIALGSLLFASFLLSYLLGMSLIASLLIPTVFLLFSLLFVRPLWLLGLLLVLRMSLDYSTQHLALTLFDRVFSLSQLLGVAVASLGLLLLVKEWRRFSSFPLLAPALLFATWGVISLFLSTSPARSFFELIRFFDLFILSFLAFISVRSVSHFRFLLVSLLASAIIPVTIGLSQFIFRIGFEDQTVLIPRIFGTFSHPNVFSLFLMTEIAIALLALLYWFRVKLAQFILTIFLFLVTLTLVLTYTRIAWIALFVFLFLLALRFKRVLLIPLFLFPLVLIVFSSTVRERVQDTFNPTPDSSVVWRQELWHDLLLKTELDQREVFGYGLDTFSLVAESLRGERFGSTEAHNDIVKFFVEGGYVGLFVYLTFHLIVFIILLRARAQLPLSSPIAQSLLILVFLSLSLLVASLSDNVYKNTPVQWILWSLMGALLALARFERVPQKILK